MINGFAQESNSYRLDIGGSQIVANLQQIASLKYPELAHCFNLASSFSLFESYCRISANYLEDMIHLKTKVFPEVLFQIPFDVSFSSTIPNPEESRLAKEASKQAASLRSKEMMARRREEQLTHKQALFMALDEIKQEYDANRISEEEFLVCFLIISYLTKERIQEGEFEHHQDFIDTYDKLQKEINVILGKIAGVKEEEDKEDKRPIEVRFPLISQPDETLSFELRSQKKTQLLQYARLLKKRDREEQKSRDEVRRNELLALYKQNPKEVIAELEMKKKSFVDRLSERKFKRSELKNSRSFAAKKRMQTVAHLGIAFDFICFN